MRNTGLLIILVGVFIIINAGSFRDVVLGKAKFNFINPTTSATPPSSTTSAPTSQGQTHQQVVASGNAKGGP